MIQKVALIIFSLIVFNLVFYQTGLARAGSLGSFVTYLSLMSYTYLAVRFHKKVSQEVSQTVGFFWIITLLLQILSLFRDENVQLSILSLMSLCSFFSGVFYLIRRAPADSFEQILMSPLLMIIQFGLNLLLLPITLLIKIDTYVKNISGLSAHTLKIATKGFKASLITVPFLLATIFLLFQADYAFASAISNILNFDLAALFHRVIPTCICAIFLLNIMTMTSYGKDTLTLSRFSRFWKSEIMVLPISMSIILTGFMLIQYPYVFGSSTLSQLNQVGVSSFSEYVNRGFMELSLVVGISILATVVSHSTISLYGFFNIKKYNYILLGISLLFTTSIFRRLWLYISFHGLTIKRINGTAVLIVFVGLIGSVLIRHLRKTNSRMKFIEYVIICIGFSFPALINSEFLLAPNRFPPTVNGEIDYNYLYYNLSLSQFETWHTAYEMVQIQYPEKEMYPYWESEIRNLAFDYDLENQNNQFRWYRYNYARHKAYLYLKEQRIL